MAKKEKTVDYVPHGDKEFEPWFKFMVQYVSERCTGNAPPWKHIPKTALDALTAAYTAWNTAYTKCLEPHAKPVTVAKDEAKMKAVSLIRPFVAQYLMFPPVTNADRAAMNLHNREKRGATESPDKAPSFSVRPYAACMLAVDFRPEGSAGKARPYGTEGAMVCYAILDHPPSGPEELTERKLATRTPFKIELKESDRGKRVYIALYWLAPKGRQSPWSVIQMAIVP